MGDIIQINTELLLTWGMRILVLLTAMPIHESAHAFTAYRLGDTTAKQQGRLTFNPFRHLDLLGSLMIIFAGFGWAKPVPVDPRNFKNPRAGMAVTAVAGPVSNILLSAVLLAVYKMIVYHLGAVTTAMGWVLYAFSVVIFTNLRLAAFNLLPVPPLDGSKFFGALLPEKFYFTIMRYERYIAIVLVVLMVTGSFSRPIELAEDALFAFINFLTKPVDLLLGG